MAVHFKSTVLRARRALEIQRSWYEPERQDRSTAAAIRGPIGRELGISEATYYRYRRVVERCEAAERMQGKLF